MKNYVICLVALIAFTNVNADTSTSVQEGAQGYDWQTCIAAKTNECVGSCGSSPDISCSSNCDSLAKDKCMSEGISPPPP